MNQGAEILVRTCAGVKKGESIVIVTDEQRLAIGQAIRMAAINVEGQTVLVVSPTRSIDNEEPTPPVAVAIKAADVVFLPVTHALAHTRANLEAIIAGARVVSMTAFTEQMMRSGGLFTDFRKNKPDLCAIILLSTSHWQRV